MGEFIKNKEPIFTLIHSNHFGNKSHIGEIYWKDYKTNIAMGYLYDLEPINISRLLIQSKISKTLIIYDLIFPALQIKNKEKETNKMLGYIANIYSEEAKYKRI